MKKSWAAHTWTGIEFTLKNFATPIAFFVMFQAKGAKPAIALALAVTALTLAAHWLLRLALSPFFLVAAGFTVVLGSIDLFIQTPQFFRFEPFAQNALMGVVFLATVFMKTPLATWFAASLPEAIRPRLDESSRNYLRGVTAAWGIYFLAKSGLFLYLALKVDLGRLIVLRSVIGGLSLGLMFGGEFAYRSWVWAPRRAPAPQKHLSL